MFVFLVMVIDIVIVIVHVIAFVAVEAICRIVRIYLLGRLCATQAKTKSDFSSPSNRFNCPFPP